MQRYCPVAAVRASSSASPTEYIVDEYSQSGTVEEVSDDGILDDGLTSEVSSDVSTPVSLRVVNFIDSGRSAGSRKRKRAKLNHLSSEQKVERRKILNRIAAQTARDRKKVQTDELERLVKELASENMRLARENAQLKQKSTDLEVENVKLRTHLGKTTSTSKSTQQSLHGTSLHSAAVALRGGKQLTIPISNLMSSNSSEQIKPVCVAARISGSTTKTAKVGQSAESNMSAVENLSMEPIEESLVSDHVQSSSQTILKRTSMLDPMESRTTSNGARDAASRNAAAVCVGTQQQYSFARRARALFSVLYALLLVGLRGASPCHFGTSAGHSVQSFRVDPVSRHDASRPRPIPAGSKRTHAQSSGSTGGTRSAESDTGQLPEPNSSGIVSGSSTNPNRGNKLERLGALVARQIAHSAPLREAYWKLRRSGALTPQTVAWMRQRIGMSAHLATLRQTSNMLHLRVVSASGERPSSWSLMEDLRGL